MLTSKAPKSKLDAKLFIVISYERLNCRSFVENEDGLD